MTGSKLVTKKQYTTTVFIDLSKAFDNVLHEHLLLTLQACGISDTALRWFRNFLFDRQQRVVVNNKSSSFFTCNKGVPQGSVLGPLLFNIYVADLPSLAREHGAKMPSFADDMTLYCSHTSAALACSSVSAALKDTSRALALRGLSINVSKTVAMVIAPHSRACQGLPTGVRLLLQNEEVKLVSQTRLLGIVIDDSLSWSPHVDSICKKVGRKIGALRRTYRQLTPTARRQFFVSVIQPDLEYAASATIPFMPTGQQDRLLALWKKAVRCLAGVHPQDDVLPLIRKFKADALIASLVPSTVHHNPTLSPTGCSGVTPGETSVFTSTNIVPVGDNTVTSDHFSRRRWLVVSHSQTEHLSCGTCFPGRCKPPVPC